MKKLSTLILSCLTLSLSAQQFPDSRSCSITDIMLSAQDMTLCPSNSGTDISSVISDLGTIYYLRDDANDDTIAGPVVGDGNPIIFNTGSIASTTTYNVIAAGTKTALEFDGIDDMVNCDTPPVITGDFTMECWVNHTVNTLYPAYISTWTNAPLSGWWIGSNLSGQPEFWIGNSFIQSTQIVSDGNWHHVAAVYYMATGNSEIYIDGVLEVAGVLPFVAPTVNLTLGNDYTGEALEGKLDEVRIWNRALSATEIANGLCNFDKSNADLIRYFDFEDGMNSSTLSDLSANNVDGILEQMDSINDWILGDACGNCEMELSTLITVTIEDVEAPVISNCPGNILLEADSPGCTGMVSWNDPTASDNCSTPTFTSTHTSPDLFPVGTTSVTYIFDDGNGNTASCTFDVTITLNFSASGTSSDEISGSDGTIDLTVTGGNLPYAFSWIGPNGFTSSNEDLTGLESGTYDVTVADANGCTTTTQVIVNTQVGINEIAENDFMIYPNPTNGIFMIKSNFKTGNDITVMDATGRLIISQKDANETVAIDLSSLESGVYFVQIKNDSASKAVRVVLQK